MTIYPKPIMLDLSKRDAMSEFSKKSIQEARDRGINPDNFEDQDHLDEAIRLHHQENGETPAVEARRKRREARQAAEAEVRPDEIRY